MCMQPGWAAWSPLNNFNDNINDTCSAALLEKLINESSDYAQGHEVEHKYDWWACVMLDSMAFVWNDCNYVKAMTV